MQIESKEIEVSQTLVQEAIEGLALLREACNVGESLPKNTCTEDADFGGRGGARDSKSGT